MRLATKLAALFAIQLAILPNLVHAHNQGTSFEKTIGAHIVDIGYDPSELTAGGRLVLDFSLRDSASSKEKSFDRVWVRIEEAGDTFLATGVSHANIGPTTLLIRLPDPLKSPVIIHARYEKGEEALVETEVTLTPVNSEATKQGATPFVSYIVVFAGGFAVSYLLRKMYFRT